ncbi:DEAD/DEAH box helicase [candidate division KSB1 bacterium]|nr:DEAD/DEAH box helicase [candidate division KSB1 bacterium]
MTTFEELGIQNDLLKGIHELGFEKPMSIQIKAIPLLLKQQKDMIGLAQTGTGKTAAFGLPLIQSIDISNKNTQSVILAPTRELCLQIASDLNNYAKYVKGLNIVTVYGGADIERQISAIKKGAQIIVATPGRMDDLLNRRKKIDLSKVKTVVLDEADEMLSMGFKEELDAILERTPATKRTLLFSATMSAEVLALSKNYLHDPVEIAAGQRNTGAENVKHTCYTVHEKDRYFALKRIVDYNPDIYGIIFCRTREETKNIARKLMQDGYNADALHGDLSQAQRESVMHKFRVRNLKLLTATDVAARGLDVKELTHIINYRIPDDVTGYIHRSGRTGRAGHTGSSIVIINLKEKYKIRQIEAKLGKKFKMSDVPDGIEICEKQLFQFIDRLERIEIDHREINRFLPQIYEKLAWLNREDLIKHFVALQFNHFLDYYKNSEDIQRPTDKTTRTSKKSKKSQKAENKTSRTPVPAAEDGFTRFYINLGERDKLTPPELIGLVNKNTRQRNIDIGKIDIMRKFSFFEVEEQYTDKVLNGFDNANFKKRKVVVEISNAGTETTPSTPRNGNGKRSSRRPRKNMKSRRRL